MHINHPTRDLMTLRLGVERFVSIAKAAIEREDYTPEQLRAELQRIHDEGAELLLGKRDPKPVIGGGGFDNQLLKPTRRGK